MGIISPTVSFPTTIFSCGSSLQIVRLKDSLEIALHFANLSDPEKIEET